MTVQDRCPWKIRYGTRAEATAWCDKTDHLTGRRAHDRDGNEVQTAEPDREHEGPGLIAGQRIHWDAYDRRTYTGEWPGYCEKIPLPVFSGGCVLPAGHHGRCAP